MSNHQGDESAGTGPDPGQNDDKPTNTLGDVQNLLGFLIAGFGAVLSFIGLRSAEVTTVLRNDPAQASLIALFLLLGVLAAVLTVATNSSRIKAPLPSAVAIVVALFGVGALLIHAIPIGQRSGTSESLVIGLVLVSVGIITLVVSAVVAFRKRAGSTKVQADPNGTMKPPPQESRREETTQNQSGEEKDKTTTRAEQKPQDQLGSPRHWLLEPIVPLSVILILVSVIFISTSAYGAMRIETDSQLSFSAQVGATFSTDGPQATVSVHIAATKIPQTDWVFVDVYAVPAGTRLTGMCESVIDSSKYAAHASKGALTSLIDHCMTDPCVSEYFGNQIETCNVLLNGSVVPNATGDVDETLSVPLLTAKYQDVDVRAEVCSLNQVCEGSLIGQNSRLDWVISNSLNKSP